VTCSKNNGIGWLSCCRILFLLDGKPMSCLMLLLL
jgi:hypothetical protein